MKLKILILISLFFAVIFVGHCSAAETNFLPNMMHGQATVTSPSAANFFGGLGGNQSIVNFQNDHRYELKADTSLGCSGKIDITDIVCLIFSSPPSNSVGLLTSKTSRDDVAEIETAALLYPKNSILGEVFGTSNVLPGVSQFGQHLYSSGDDNSSSDAFYKSQGYTFNPEAQAYWNPTSGNSAMTAKIDQIKRGYKNLIKNNIVVGGISWSNAAVNFDGICGISSGVGCVAEMLRYPDGRVWSADSSQLSTLFINNSISYKNKSTIIIAGSPGGDLELMDANLTRRNNSDRYSFGIIVTNGNINIQNTDPTKKLTIYASMFVPNGNIRITGNNIDLIGSFVAKNFILSDAANQSNINFIQDTRGESVWPPGFRDLRPLSTKSK